MCPTYISTLFEQPAIKYKLRNHDFTIPRFNTVSFGKHSLRYMSPKVRRSVPSNVKKGSTLSSFNYNIGKVDLSMLLDENNCSNCSLCISQCFISYFFKNNGYICTYSIVYNNNNNNNNNNLYFLR